jgi:hypothetical protein
LFALFLKKLLLMRKLTAALLCLLPALLYAQVDDSLFIRKLADDILAKGKAHENLRVLCKTVGARLSGSPQMVLAEAWGVKTLQDMGADKVYLQECMVPHWVRGGKDEVVINYTNAAGKKIKQQLDVLALGNSVGTNGKALTAPIILINDFNELEQKKEAIKGKIVLFNNIFSPLNISPGKSYGESGAYRRQGPGRAAKYGAVAVMIRSVTGSTDNNPHTGATNYDTLYPKIPAAAIGLQDADRLINLLKAATPVTLSYTSNAKFLPDTIGHNVIGELRGSEFPDQYITVGGHLDSWDPAEGAHDDGTGCVHSIEVLRALKALGYRPKNTIRVVLFANEENGLRGGNKYAEQAKANNEQHVLAMESDGGGFTPRGFGCTMSANQLAKMKTWLPLFLPYGVYDIDMGGGGADIGPLNRLLKTPLVGFEGDGQRYFDLHHARNDVFENVHKRELELGALNMAILIYLVDKYGL